MPPNTLKIMGVDPGGITGWAVFEFPRLSMFGDEEPEIVSWDTGEFFGSEEEQALQIAAKAVGVQGMDYKLGPAVVVEDWDYGSPLRDPQVYSPLRIAAQLRLLHHMGRFGDARLVFQSRTMAKKTFTDERLRFYGYYVPNSRNHEKDAVRHALTALRRARMKTSVANKLWDASIAAQPRPQRPRQLGQVVAGRKFTPPEP